METIRMDLSKMTEEELIELAHACKAEIIRRDTEGLTGLRRQFALSAAQVKMYPQWMKDRL
jgi:hypothetical protein